MCLGASGLKTDASLSAHPPALDAAGRLMCKAVTRQIAFLPMLLAPFITLVVLDWRFAKAKGATTRK